MFEDERLVVTLDSFENDRFFIHGQLTVSLRDPDQYLLITDPAQAAGDPRKAILVSARQECVIDSLTSSLQSFTIGSDSAAERLLNQLEQSAYHITCLDVTAQLQPDGSLRLTTLGDATAMTNVYGDDMNILTALSFTNADGEGRTEIFHRTIPSAEPTLRTILYKAQNGFEDLSLISATMYYDTSGAWLSVRYNGPAAAGNVTLTCTDQPAWSGLTSAPVHRAEESYRAEMHGPVFYTVEYDHLLFRLEGLDDLTDVFYPALTFPDGKVVQLVSDHIGTVNVPSPTAVPSSAPAASPTPLQNMTLTIADKPVKYAHYKAALYIYEDRSELVAWFRYHDPLPEGTVLRLVAVNGEAIEPSEALVGPGGLENTAILAARIPVTLVSGAKRYTLAAYVPDAEEPLFEVILQGTEFVNGGGGNGNMYAPGGEIYQPMTTPSFPFKNAIEDGFDLTPDIDYGFGIGW